MVNERLSRQGQNVGRKGNVMYTSRELPAVFQNTVGASRETLGGDYFVPTFRQINFIRKERLSSV
jgi:hypothetical protein